MNANAQSWVDALRSGRFEQGQTALHRERPGETDTFCCLGVACQLAIEAGVDVEVTRVESDERVCYGDLGGSPSYLPKPVQEWLGLASSSGDYYEVADEDDEEGYDKNTLASRNDHDADFDEIADIIEAEPEGLFEEGD